MLIMFRGKKENAIGESESPGKDGLQTRQFKTSSLLKISACLLFFRWVNAVLVQTSFVPDEYWQSLEVAHNMVFGYGYLTWEWRTGLRGYTYPAIFAFCYKILHTLGLDYPYLLIRFPYFLQATFSAGQDVALFLLSWQLIDEKTAWWTLFCQLSSWFTFYTAPRTLSNTMESVCTTIGLLFYPWPSSTSKHRCGLRTSILFAALACIMRPTAAIIWLPLSVWYLIRTYNKLTAIFLQYLPVGSVILVGSMLVDRLFYGKWVFVQYNFLEFNVLHHMGSFYGSHPWHWYVTQGVPVVLGAHLPIVLLGARGSVQKLLPISLLVVWVVFIYSFLSHKEFRFILPVLPLCFILSGYYIAQCRPTTQHLLVAFLLIFNAPVALYTGLLHQRGTIDVMTFLQQELGSKVTSHQSVLFLMPCHSTPFYSHLHMNVDLRFPTCEPNLKDITGYVDESSVFYVEPERWLKGIYHHGNNPSYIIMFDVLQEKVQSFLDAGNYHKITEFFHTHFPEGRVGSNVLVFHRQEQSAVR